MNPTRLSISKKSFFVNRNLKGEVSPKAYFSLTFFIVMLTSESNNPLLTPFLLTAGKYSRKVWRIMKRFLIDPIFSGN
ncbi:MAG: hypothetical protein A2026_12035 [Deltaproteobacteria bacterium RBG_19FT_COMBO_46_12]|nr:MAG: hypothetical protein A2026_12035 [Deltaproteobacteria bacterium RBG_19FT_COMBO_46_12]